uniref:2-oxoglutarate reductase n=1 Tax=Spongospora subterranea TaxID=70186 RepID=A0A0H5QJ80_9EUKA|eukprot:CRZ01707.1 hypothetical protein [Spongospora subterranea]
MDDAPAGWGFLWLERDQRDGASDGQPGRQRVYQTCPINRASAGERQSQGESSNPRSLVNAHQKPVRVLLLEAVSQSAIDAFERRGYEVEMFAKIDKQTLLSKIPSANIIGVRSKTQLTAEILQSVCKTEPVAIGCFCIGTDQTDLETAGSLGVPVFNAPFANTRSVAEIAIACIIGLARSLGDCNTAMHQGIWLKAAKNRYEVRGKTLGIIGYGHVGSQLSVLAEALGMRVIFFDIDRCMPLGNAQATNTQQQLLSESDFVSLHVPLTQSTINLIGEREISQMKQGASFLLNFARGKCVDHDALAAALKSKTLLGAAIDVFPSEPAAGGDFVSVLQNCPNTILTSHIGGSTEEAQENIGTEVAEKLIDYVESGSSVTAVNFPHIALPCEYSKTRILNVHHNVPGVLREINNVLSDYNISAQVLGTHGKIGYMICQIDSEIAQEVYSKIAALPNSIRTRIIGFANMSGPPSTE